MHFNITYRFKYLFHSKDLSECSAEEISSSEELLVLISRGNENAHIVLRKELGFQFTKINPYTRRLCALRS